MVEAHFGPTIDILGGGLDLVSHRRKQRLLKGTCAHRVAPFMRTLDATGF